MKLAIGNLEWIAERSLRNCHCPGVDSILFNDKPEQRVRVFIAQENHQLWRNEFPFKERMSIGLHPHHCNVELRPIFGTIWNVVRRPGGAPVRLDCYRYESPIRPTGTPAIKRAGSFKKIYTGAHFCICMEQLADARDVGRQIRTAMPAQAIHTIYVPKGERAAWFVFESREDKEYQPLCWSINDLEKFDFDLVNHSMSVKYLEGLLDSVPELGATAGRHV